MRFTDSTLIAAIDAACRSADPAERAIGHNFKWDERLGPQRAAAFQQPRYQPKDATFKGVKEAYDLYKKERVRWDARTRPVTEPFLPVNDHAALAHLPDENRVLVRLMDIGQALDDSGLSFTEFRNAVEMVKGIGSRHGRITLDEANATVERFLDQWNAFDRRMPAFVGFELDVRPELDGDHWADGLRRRYGIGHLDVPAGADPIPVMLLRYTVGELIAAAKRWCPASDAIRVPTILESNCYEFFFPAPTPLPYGRTVDLAGGLDTDRLTCELVHLPVDLEIGHIDRVGQLTKPIPDLTLAQVRNDHLEILRYECERDDFGDRM